jgi:hypothetical protein
MKRTEREAPYYGCFMSSRYFRSYVKYSAQKHFSNTSGLAIQSAGRHSGLNLYLPFSLQTHFPEYFENIDTHQGSQLSINLRGTYVMLLRLKHYNINAYTRD